MKYNVGDRVRIKSLDWYNEHKDETDDIECSNNIWFYKEMSKFCGKVMTISHVRVDHYTMVEDLVGYWIDEMIECKVEKETKPIDLTVKGEETKERIEIVIPEGYEYVIESGKIIFTKKKKEYPKTYKECCEVIVGRKPNPNEISFGKMELCLVDLDNTQSIDFQNPLLFQLNSLFRLLMCRNAYYKIAGEEMGLGKPWEPDWNTSEPKYVIAYTSHGIEKQWETTYCKGLAFPTAEMRDEFYDNFKEEIEQCKEFL